VKAVIVCSPVAVARNACSSFIAGHLASTVTRAGKHSVELAADHLFDELTRPNAQLGLDGLDRIKPVVEKINSHLDCGLRRIRLHGSARHGVVSSPALQTPDEVDHPGDYATLNSTSRRHVGPSRMATVRT
jgi:hypothetical protein